MSYDVLQSMLDSVPYYYRENREAYAILSAEAYFISGLMNDARQATYEFAPSTATDMLSKWEDFVGLVVDPSKPIDQRRSAVLARFRGTGAVTIPMIKAVAESFENGSVEVTEDNPNYTITIAFADSRGVPPNIPDLHYALREIVPAHIEIMYEFTYTTYDEIKSFYGTYADMIAEGILYEGLLSKRV